MVAGDGSFLAQNRGSARLPEDFNCDSSTTAFEVVLTGADPDVSRAATLEVEVQAANLAAAEWQVMTSRPLRALHTLHTSRCVMHSRASQPLHAIY